MAALDLDTAESYWLAITQIEAQQLLLQLSVSQYPWMKKESQKRLHRQWHRLAYPETHDETKALTTAELAERIKAGMRG